METWKILLLLVLAAVLLGCVGGAIIGKYMVKRMRSKKLQVLSKKEKIIYLSCAMLGAAMILFGIFFKFPGADATMDMGDAAITGEAGAVMAAPRRGGGVRIRMG